MELIQFELYNNDFTWDMVLHFPVPTLNYITRRTGQNLNDVYATEEEAKGAVIAAVRSAKTFLFNNRTDMKEWEYLAAHDINTTYNVLEYILEFINFALITGDYIEYFKATPTKNVSLGLEAAKKNLLGGRLTLPFVVKYREGY